MDNNKNETFLDRMKNEFFTGRHDIFKRIDSLTNKKIIILNGAPGVGKTSVAFEFVYSKIKDGSLKNAYFFDADDKEKISAQMLHYGRGLVDYNPSIQPEETISNFIESVKDSDDVMLVFDNIEDLNDVKNAIKFIDIYFMKCKILITTRKQLGVSRDGVENIDVLPFNIIQTRQFLRSRLTYFEENQIEALLEKLKEKYQHKLEDGTEVFNILPYYLVILASSLMRADKKIDFNLEFENKFMKSLLANLEDRSSDIIFLLKYIMLIDPDHISVKLIERIIPGKEACKKAVNVLKEQNLCKIVRPYTKHYGISVHRMFQEDLRENLGLTPEEITEKELYLLRLLENGFPVTDYQPDDNWSVADLYYRHIKKLYHVIPSLEEDIAAKLYYKLSLYKRFVLVDYKSALDDANKAFVSEIKQETCEKFLAKLYAHMGGIYSLLSKENEAIENYKQALKKYETFFGDRDRREIASIYNNIGLSYATLSKHKEALKYKELALDIKQRIFKTDDDNDNLELANSLDAIAGTYFDTGYTQKSFDFYERALIIREKIIKKDDPYLANSYNLIGLSYCRLNDNVNAREYFLKSLKMRQKLYKGDHHEIAISFNNLGLVHSLMHDETNALEYKMKTLEMRKRLYGEDHHRLTISYHIIGRSFKNLENHPKAIQYYKLALEMKQRIFGNADHLETIAVLDDLGSSYSSIGAENKALEYYTEFTEMKNRIHKSESYAKIDLLTDNSYLCFALSYCNLGETKKAYEFLEKCLAIKFEVTHLISIRNYKIGYLYYKLKDTEKAIECYTNAVESKTAVKNCFVADCYTHMALVYSSLGDKENSLKYQQLSSEIHEELFRKDDHPKIATNLYNIGIIHSNLGDHEESLRYHVLAKDMRIRVFGDRHFTVFKSYKKIGLEYSYLGNQNKALEFLHRALELRTELFKDDSLYVAKIYKCLGEVYFKSGKFTEALESYNSSLSMLNNFLLSPENETLKECLDAVSKINGLLG